MNKKKAALEKLKQAQIKEQQSLKSYLQRAGLIFNGNELVGDRVTGGSVTDRLKDAQNWANKASGAEKEWRIKDTQYLKEQIDTYYDLMNSIGSTQGSLNDLNLEIRNAKKEHEELLKAVENLSDRYLQITMRLERLNSELSINQSKYDDLLSKKGLVVLIVDLFDFTGTFIPKIIDKLRHFDNVLGCVLSGAGSSILIISEKNNVFSRDIIFF